MSMSQAPGAQPEAGREAAPGLAQLFSGPPRYRAITPWGPFEAFAITAVAAFFAPLLMTLPIVVYEIVQSGGTSTAKYEMSLASPMVLTVMVVSQLTSIALIWLVAGRANMRPDTLQYRQTPPTWVTAIAAGLIIVVTTSVLELALHALGKFDPFGETKMLLDGLRSQYWWATIIVAVVLAPIWEELAFRGFLLTALAKTKLGIVGGGLISNTVWTLMHLQYSSAGMASVFLAGIILTWIVWRTASIRACIVAHAVINAASLTFLSLFAPA